MKSFFKKDNHNFFQVYTVTEVFRSLWYSLPIEVCDDDYHLIVGARCSFAVSTEKHAQ